MAERRIGPVLDDILDSIEGVQKHTSGKTLAEFQNDWLLRLAVQRALEIISEACRHIPDELLENAADIPWRKIRGIGNVLRHDYHRVADDIIWVVVIDNLPPLKTAITQMRQSLLDRGLE